MEHALSPQDRPWTGRVTRTSCRPWACRRLGLLAWATILIELLGGAAVTRNGAFIALASVPMAVVLLVAIITVHLPNGFSSIKLESVTAAGAHFGQPGYETDLLYLAALAALVLGGPGPLAFSAYLKRFRIGLSLAGFDCYRRLDLYVRLAWPRRP